MVCFSGAYRTANSTRGKFREIWEWEMGTGRSRLPTATVLRERPGFPNLFPVPRVLIF